MDLFTHFIAIDWSGAKSGYGNKLQIGLCKKGKSAPVLVTADKPWSRESILHYLKTQILSEHCILVGIDFSFAPPFMDHKAYLHGVEAPVTAKNFWQFVEAQCDDPDLGAASFVDVLHYKQFYHGLVSGEKTNFMRLRACEHSFNAAGGGKPSSIFDAVGAAQVAKASFAGMRFLHHIKNDVAIWPFDFKPHNKSVLVEIYCRAFIRHAGLRGKKIRSLDELNIALAAFGSKPVTNIPNLTDDKTDVLISAAGLRHISSDPRYWKPLGLTPDIAAKEGWTFGVL